MSDEESIDTTNEFGESKEYVEKYLVDEAFLKGFILGTFISTIGLIIVLVYAG